MSARPGISVIVPVCHGGSFLAALVEALCRLHAPPEGWEALIAGAAHDHRAREAVERAARDRLAPIRYVGCDSPHKAARLNAACALARGEALLFTDDDCVPPPDWLTQFRAALREEPEVAILGGSDEPLGERSAFDAALDGVFRSFIATGGGRGGGRVRAARFYPKLWNMAVRRDAASKAALPDGGIFDITLPVHEDVELAQRIERAGGRIGRRPEIVVRHSRDTTFAMTVKRNFRMARVSARLKVHRAAHLCLSGAILGAASLAAASIFFAPMRWPLAALLTAYVLMIAGAGVAAGWRARSVRVLALTPALIASLHTARGLGYLYPLGSALAAQHGEEAGG